MTNISGQPQNLSSCFPNSCEYADTTCEVSEISPIWIYSYESIHLRKLQKLQLLLNDHLGNVVLNDSKCRPPDTQWDSHHWGGIHGYRRKRPDWLQYGRSLAWYRSEVAPAEGRSLECNRDRLHGNPVNIRTGMNRACWYRLRSYGNGWRRIHRHLPAGQIFNAQCSKPEKHLICVLCAKCKKWEWSVLCHSSMHPPEKTRK